MAISEKELTDSLKKISAASLAVAITTKAQNVAAKVYLSIELSVIDNRFSWVASFSNEIADVSMSSCMLWRSSILSISDIAVFSTYSAAVVLLKCVLDNIA